MSNVQRRELLLSAAAVGLVMGASTSGASAAQGIEIPEITVGAAVVDQPTVSSADKEKEIWNALIERLKAYQPWLSTFDTSFEKKVAPELIKIGLQENAKLTHNARLVEPLLGEISSLLDRCLGYRRESSELEIQGVSAGLNRLASDMLNEIDQKLAATDISAEIAAIIAVNYPKAAESFQKLKLDADLGQASAIQANVQATTNEKLRDALLNRAALSKAKLSFVQLSERQLLGRHAIEGNAHNYGERFDRLRTLFESDVKSAMRRAFAASRGLSALFGFTKPVPDVKDDGYIEELVAWTKEAMRAVTLIGENEIELRRRIPIPLSSNTFKVNFDGAFRGLKNVRLRQVAMTFGAADDQINNNSRINALFSTVLLKVKNEIGPQVVLPFSEVSSLSAQREPYWVSGAHIYNVVPEGEWTGRISAKGHSPGSDEIKYTDFVQRLFVHLDAVGVPDPAQDGSWWTTGEDQL